MKKFLLILLGGLILIGAGIYYGLGPVLNSGILIGVNNLGPKVTQTHVSLADARISPFSGRGTLTGLVVGNPNGWNAPNAFTLGKIDLKVNLRSLRSDVLEIEEIVIEQPEFVYETRLVSSNLGDLLKAIEAFAGPSTPADSPQPDSQPEKPVKLIVRHFRLVGAKATLGVGPAALPVPLPLIELHDLGLAKGGATPAELSGEVLGQVLGEIAKAAANPANVGTAAGKGVSEAAKKATTGLKKLLGK